MLWIGRGRGDDRGQALAEIAVVIPVFLLALVGVLDVGRLVFTNSVVSQAAREGARLAATEVGYVGLSNSRCVASTADITSSNPGAQVCPADVPTLKANVVEAVNRMTITAGALATVHISCNAGDDDDPAPSGEWTETSGGNGCKDGSGDPIGVDGEIVSVRVTHDYSPMTPVIADLVGTVALVGTTSMVIN